MSTLATATSRGLLVALMLVAGCTPEDGASLSVEEGPPESEAPPFFVGRWAAAETACGHAAWSFTPDGLSTPGEVSCTFDRVTETTAGYDIAAMCTAESPPRPERIRLSYAQSAQAMLVEGGPFNPVGLVACDGQKP